MKYLSPWINKYNDYFLGEIYQRISLNNDQNISIEKDRYGYYSFFIISSLSYNRLDEIKQIIDEKLIQEGFVLLTQEKFDKLRVLV
jgi:hypothetical protein